MHNYLRAIGFSSITSMKKLQTILKLVKDKYDEKIVVTTNDDNIFMEISKSFGVNCGIKVCGEYEEDGMFYEEYYFPYFTGTAISTKEDIVIEKHFERESYVGACDDVRIGVSLVFYIQNAASYIKESEQDNFSVKGMSATFSGLSIQGNILFPVVKNENNLDEEKNDFNVRSKLIAAARSGDETALESLTIEDLETYSMISRRLLKEDVFTIIESYFMPHGMECDQYSIMGEVKEYKLVTNTYTKENIYQLTLNCNDMLFDICINEQDLVGTPQVGRRFKGVIWLQGKINID